MFRGSLPGDGGRSRRMIVAVNRRVGGSHGRKKQIVQQKTIMIIYDNISSLTPLYLVIVPFNSRSDGFICRHDVEPQPAVAGVEAHILHIFHNVEIVRRIFPRFCPDVLAADALGKLFHTPHLVARC